MNFLINKIIISSCVIKGFMNRTINKRSSLKISRICFNKTFKFVIRQTLTIYSSSRHGVFSEIKLYYIDSLNPFYCTVPEFCQVIDCL